MSYQAIAFDTGGTVLDWHAGLLREVIEVEDWQSHAIDWHVFVNTWRRNAMKRVLGRVRPAYHMDDAHWEALEETIDLFKLPKPAFEIRQCLWAGWHRLRAWPDFPPALARIRKHLPVVSFTMLPLALVLDVSRLNALVWDAVISCQMIGVYKPNPEAYLTAAIWMGMAPQNILMVACHNFDLNAAQDAGFRTAFVYRPDEWGPAGPPDPKPNRSYDHVCANFAELAASIGALHTVRG